MGGNKRKMKAYSSSLIKLQQDQVRLEKEEVTKKRLEIYNSTDCFNRNRDLSFLKSNKICHV